MDLVHFHRPTDHWMGYVMLCVGEHDVEMGKWHTMAFQNAEGVTGYVVSWHAGAIFSMYDGILESALDHAIGTLTEYRYG